MKKIKMLRSVISVSRGLKRWIEPPVRFGAFMQEKQERLIRCSLERELSDDDKHWAELKNFGHKYVHIPEHLLRDYDRLLMGGIWAQGIITTKSRRASAAHSGSTA